MLNKGSTGWIRPTLVMGMAMMALLQPVHADATDSAPKRFKKQTVVDFEDALIEGKSRKPYSAYLSKQKKDEFQDLFSWELDLDKRVQSSTKSLMRIK